MDTEARLARLEEQLYFQETALQELSDTVFTQQRQIDTMQKLLDQMNEQEQKLLNMVEEKPENTLPPHYMPERY